MHSAETKMKGPLSPLFPREPNPQGAPTRRALPLETEPWAISELTSSSRGRKDGKRWDSLSL